MGVISELVDIIRDISSLGEDQIEHAMNRKHYSSIAQRSLEGTLQFPAIVSDSIDIETLQTVTKALEKQFASFTQTALTMSPFLNIKSDKDAAGYLRKFHKNMGTSPNLRNDVLNLISSVGESYDAYSGDGKVVLSTVSEGSNYKITKENKEGLQDVLEGLNTTTLNSLYIPKSIQRRNYIDVMEKTTVKTDGGRADVTTVVQGGSKTKIGDQHNTYNINRMSTDGGMGGGGGQKYENKLPNRVLLDNDVKKSNELIATTMHVRTILIDDDKPYGNLDFIAGVKATMHPVSSQEMVTNLQRAVTKGGKLFKTLRLTSGEISFMKDYVMNLTELRDDARSTSETSNKWWSALKRRKKLAKFKKRILLPGDILPTASVVTSIEEVEYMRSEFGIDMLDSKVSRKIMDEYFLISFNVVDVASGVVHFFFDGYNGFQTVTFSGLERGDVSGGVDFKDVMKLVQRV